VKVNYRRWKRVGDRPWQSVGLGAELNFHREIAAPPNTNMQLARLSRCSAHPRHPRATYRRLAMAYERVHGGGQNLLTALSHLPIPRVLRGFTMCLDCHGKATTTSYILTAGKAYSSRASRRIPSESPRNSESVSCTGARRVCLD
jgi:hypothetical protein